MHDHSHGDHNHAGHSVAMFRDRFWLSLALTVPTLVWGHMLPRALGYTPPQMPGAHLIPPVFGAVVYGAVGCDRVKVVRPQRHDGVEDGAGIAVQ